MAEQSENDRQLEGDAEGEDRRHDQRQIFADLRQKLDRRLARNVDLLQRHRKADQKRHHDEIDEQRAEQEEERGRNQIGSKSQPLVAVEARRDKLVDLNGDDRKGDDRRPEHAEPDVGVELLEKMGGDERRLFSSDHAHVRIGKNVVYRAGKIEADDKGGQEGVEGPDNASPELDQMVHQRRLGGVDVLLAHSAALLRAAGASGSASLSAGAALAAGSGPARAISDLSISDLPISGVAASAAMASGAPAEVEAAFVMSSRIRPTGSKLVSILAWSLIAWNSFFTLSRSASRSTSRMASINWPWNSDAMRRILPIVWPTVRITRGRSFGGITAKATIPQMIILLTSRSNMANRAGSHRRQHGPPGHSGRRTFR